MTLNELKEFQKSIISKKKQSDKKRKIVISITFILCIIIDSLLMIKNGISTLIPIIISSLTILIIMYIICIFLFNSNSIEDIELFENEYKKYFVLSSLKSSFENLKYVPEEGISKETLRNTEMVKTGDAFYSNDYVSGIYNGIKFEQSDIHIKEEREEKDKDGNVRKVLETIFKGRWMIFDFNKKFKSNVQVSNIPIGLLYNQISMEDEEFNKMFLVSAKDPHDAFYILTPHFMEKIKEIDKKLNCGIMFTFINNKLHIAINNYEDAFEPDIFDEINEKRIINDISKDIKLITDFVDELNLDNDLFRREV